MTSETGVDPYNLRIIRRGTNWLHSIYNYVDITPTNEWFHLVCTFSFSSGNAPELKVYINNGEFIKAINEYTKLIE